MKFFNLKPKVTPEPRSTATATTNAATATPSPTPQPTKPKAKTKATPKPAPVDRSKREYDLHTLVTKLSSITADYNQTRSQLQAQLFSELDNQRKTKRTVERELTDTQSNIKALKDQLVKAQQLDSSELVKQVKVAADKQAQLQAQIETLTSVIKNLENQLKQQVEHRADLSAQQRKLTLAREKIVNTLHAEQDPLKIVSLAESYRDRSEQIAQQLQALTDQQNTAATDRDNLSKNASRENEKLRQIQQQLAQAKTDQANATQAIKDQESHQTKEVDRLAQQLETLSSQQKKATVRLNDLNEQIALSKQQLLDWFGTTHQVQQLTTDDDHLYAVALDTFLPKQPLELVQTVARLLAVGTKKVGLYSALFDINLADEIDLWAQQNQLAREQLTIINPLYQIQSQGKLTGEPVKLPSNIAEQKWDEAHHELNVSLTDNHSQLKVKYRTNDQKLIKEISYFHAGHLTKRSFFNGHGLLAANALFAEDGALAQEQYYRLDGLVGLVITYQANKQSEVALFDGAGIQTNTFADTAVFTDWWLKHYFPKNCALVGQLENPAYQQLLKQTNLNAVPFVSEAYTKSDQFKPYLQQADQHQFVVANYQAAQPIIQNSPGNLELLYLNPVYLPAQIDGPQRLATS